MSGTTTNNGSTANDQSTGTSGFSSYQNTSDGGQSQLIFSPKKTTITDTQQASQQDIIASLNGVMQSLFGRLATPDEVAKYGQELLAAQRANPTRGTQELTFANTGKPLTGTNKTTSTSIDPTSFFASMLQGTAEASQYKIVGTYMDALKNMADSSKGSYNGQ